MKLWTVRFQYCRYVKAPSRGEAYKLTVKAIKDDPGSVIAKIDDSEGSGMSTKRLLKMFLWG